MGTRDVIVAAALMAMVNRCIALSCARYYWDGEYNNGTGSYYSLYVNTGERIYCLTPTACSYGLTKDSCRHCDECAKGPGESCGGTWGFSGRCISGLVCKRPKNTYRRGPYSSSIGTCVNQTTSVAECPSPWFLLNNQCFRVVSGEAERRSSASANAYCGNIALGADLAQPTNLTVLSDHLRENNFTGTYWLCPMWRWNSYDSCDADDCRELWSGNALGYGVHHLNHGSCERNMSFICERHYWHGSISIFSDYFEN